MLQTKNQTHKEAQLAYVFDPINNTLIDDEDKSLGNKLALNDDEFQKLLDIPGVFRASEAQQPPVRPDVQEIEAINRFMRDNPIEKDTNNGIQKDQGRYNRHEYCYRNLFDFLQTNINR